MRTLSAIVVFVCFNLAHGADQLPRRGTLGIPLRAAPEDVRKPLKLGDQEALQVTSDANGLAKDDLIVGVDKKRFKNFAEWQELLRTQTDKSKAKLIVLKKSGDQWKETDVEVAIQPKPADDTDKYTTVYDHVVSNGNRIRTFITKPKSPGKHPVLFWIQGINATSVDFPLGAKNYIAPVMKPFADDGFVVIRVEKTGVGDSEGGPARLVGWDEELDIYRQTLKALDRYDFIDRDNVFVFGHSMGGCHAPVVCSEIPVKGIISYGTVAMSWLEWEVRAPRMQGILSGQTHAQVDKDVRQITQFYSYVFTEKRTIDWIKKNRPELAKLADEQSPDGVMLGDRSIKYMQEVNDRDFTEYWAKLGKTKVLALFGEFDWISLREDQTTVAEAVNKANPGCAEFKVVSQSDHIFSKCTGWQDSFDRFAKPGSEFNPEVVKTMREWIDGLMKN